MTAIIEQNNDLLVQFAGLTANEDVKLARSPHGSVFDHNCSFCMFFKLPNRILSNISPTLRVCTSSHGKNLIKIVQAFRLNTDTLTFDFKV